MTLRAFRRFFPSGTGSSLNYPAAFLTLFVVMSLVCLSIFPSPSFVKSFGSMERGLSGVGNLSSLPRPLANTLEASQSRLFTPYWYVDKKTEATLEITNNIEAARTLRPVMLLRGIERVSLDPVTVPGRATARISLRDALIAHTGNIGADREDRRWGDGSRKGSLWGAAMLEGDVGGVSSWILTENTKESLLINSMFGSGDKASPIVSSMWWKPTDDSKVLFALQNISQFDLSLSTHLYINGSIVIGLPVTLPGGGSRLIDLRELLPKGKARKSLPEIGSVRFAVNNEGGLIMGRAMVIDEKVGFSVPLMMRGVLSHQSSRLQMPGTPFGRPDPSMGFPKKTKFTTHLLLTNTSENPIDVAATLDGRNSLGNPVSWDAPLIALGPYQSRVVNLEKARIKGGSPVADGHVGVRVSHTGRMIDLMIEAVTVDQTLTFSFYDPFFDERAADRIEHAVSFNLSGNKNTLLVVKNTTDEPMTYGYRINYQGTEGVDTYRAPLSELGPYELAVVDIKALRNAGKPDAEGKRLPENVSFGNASIYTDSRALIGGDPTFDAVAGTCGSCFDPCNGGGGPIIIEGGVCDPCILDPGLCGGGGGGGQLPVCFSTGALDCCQICSTAKIICYLAASAALAAALSVCASGPCDPNSDPDTNPECAICIAAAGAAYAIVIINCNLTEDNCKRSCTITHSCTCP